MLSWTQVSFASFDEVSVAEKLSQCFNSNGTIGAVVGAYKFY